MTIRTMLATMLGIICFSLPALAQVQDDKPAKPDEKAIAEALAKSLKDADAIFTADIGKVNALGQTNSIPASVFGNVTFKDAKALKGAVPEAALSYSFREGSAMNLGLEVKGKVLVATKGKGVLAIVPANEANLILAKKAIEAAKEK